MHHSVIDNRTLIVNSILRQLAEELDIPPSKYKQAVERYTSVGRWLNDGHYPGAHGEPSIYPQGSFRLGTVVRPIRDGKETNYDIDLACVLPYPKQTTTAKTIRHLVGNRLKEHGTYSEMLDEEGRRCWTLNYAEHDGAGFHIDILPCIPDPQRFSDVEERHAVQSVALTDLNKEGRVYSWGFTNPAGYADWFGERQQAVFEELSPLRKREIYLENMEIFASVDDVPDQLVRTPLQRAIQVLKRHRDVRFNSLKNCEDRPISIIINTLAALAYQGEPDVYSALANLIDRIQRYQETGLIQCENDKWVIRNPVNPNENFADRWNDEGSEKADAFFQWIGWLQEDIDQILNASTSKELERTLVESFGSDIGIRVADVYASQLVANNTLVESAFGRTLGKYLRFDVAHREQPRWHISPTRYQTRIKAKYMRNGFRPTLFRSNSAVLPKNAGLVFEAITDVPKPYSVHWQIVNSGQEATNANDLRGGFYDGKRSGRTREESTKYTGMHWAECFIVKDGVCLSRSGEFVVNIR
ncbi:nucleotidyltransferase [Roseiconus lacunae]|uniref:Cyclic GMP-AMP synthase n=1 Tax=Roseiconus lacunae TaxID=2605694 RepID=A0ABT7PFP0_9BACT|nr:nucleotidyltransferase [Roseiconus lacunae]MDM4015124.1 nucleotidyltransferase [Roseiconus lacunae]